MYKNDNTVVFIFEQVKSMPKVKEEYLEGKKEEILDAALAVCGRKPAYDMTMSDIVAQTGMSQGGVYKYYNNIDLVLADLINRANSMGDHKARIDEIMESCRSPEEKLGDLFKVSELYFTDLLIGYIKILFELGTMFAYSSERNAAISRNVKTASTFSHLIGCASQVIMTGTENGCFAPVIPVTEILAFNVASFDGIIRDVTLAKCYGDKDAPKSPVDLDEKKLIRSLYLSTMALLGKPETEK